MYFIFSSVIESRFAREGEIPRKLGDVGLRAYNPAFSVISCSTLENIFGLAATTITRTTTIIAAAAATRQKSGSIANLN